MIPQTKEVEIDYLMQRLDGVEDGKVVKNGV